MCKKYSSFFSDQPRNLRILQWELQAGIPPFKAYGKILNEWIWLKHCKNCKNYPGSTVSQKPQVRGEREWLLRIREREGNWKNPFPKFGNGKGMEKIHSRNSGTGREWKKSIPEIREREGNEKIHSQNSGTGREWKKSIPEIREREGNEKNPFPKFGKGIRGLHSWEWPGSGIPAHPCALSSTRGPRVLFSLMIWYDLNWIEVSKYVFQARQSPKMPQFEKKGTQKLEFHLFTKWVVSFCQLQAGRFSIELILLPWGFSLIKRIFLTGSRTAEIRF